MATPTPQHHEGPGRAQPARGWRKAPKHAQDEPEARFAPFSAPCHEEAVSRAFAKALKTSRGDTLTDKHTQRTQQPPEDLITAPRAIPGRDRGTRKGPDPPVTATPQVGTRRGWMHPAGEQLAAAGSSRDDNRHQKGQKERLRGHQINQGRVQAAAKSGTSPR